MMSWLEFFAFLLGVVFLYILGQILYPETPQHNPIQQELIKMGDENNGKRND